MSSDLIPMMGRLRQIRLESLRTQRVRKRIETLKRLRFDYNKDHKDDDRSGPHLIDLYMLENIKKIIELPIEDTDEDVVQENSFDSTAAHFPVLLAEQENARYAHLSQLLKQKMAFTDNNRCHSPFNADSASVDVADQFQLAVAVFKCSKNRACSSSPCSSIDISNRRCSVSQLPKRLECYESLPSLTNTHTYLPSHFLSSTITYA
jgi:hypothetical protein